MTKKKLNMTIGRFQPMTIGHSNMVEEGEAPCIVYRINSSNKIPEKLSELKIRGKKVKKEEINNVVSFLDNNGQGSLTEQEKELLKRPFTNELIDEELEIVKKNNKYILDVVPVVHVYDALDRFNAFVTEHKDEYEPQYWMCGDDRVDEYTNTINKYDELETYFNSGKKIPNILKGKLQTNTGKGRTEGVSGTAVRKAIITKDKSAFEKIMPKGVGSMFDTFVKAFEDFKDKLQNITEGEILSLKDYIIESVNINNNTNMKTLVKYIYEALNSNLDKDTLSELKELNTLSPDELINVFSILNYKKDSPEAENIINTLPKVVIDVLTKYKYASNKEKYYEGIMALYSRIKVENYVIRKLNDSEDISNIKQVSHYIDRNDNYDLKSSIGNIDVKVHFYGNKNFTIQKGEKTKADWYCFMDIDLSDITKFNDNFNNATLYLVNRKEFINTINTQAIGNTEVKDEGDYWLVNIETIKKYAKYII